MTSPLKRPRGSAEARARKAFIVGLAAGVPIMSWGSYGLLADGSRTHPQLWIRWFLGGAITHDLLVAPVVLLVGAAVARHVSARFRAPLQAGLIMSALVVLVAAPFVTGWGRIPSNPSVLPNNYARNLLIVLTVIWSTCLAYGLFAARRKLPSSPKN
jgi:hypothetical protein